MTCTFFGHRDAPQKIEPILKSTIIDLIEKNNVDLFYVGNQGQFDSMVFRILKELSRQYKIDYYVSLAYIPCTKDSFSNADFEHTVIPNGIETVPKRFAINYRNK